MKKPKEMQAQRILAYIGEKGSATRPELARVLDMKEDSVESAVRKLLEHDMLRDTGLRKRETGKRLAYIFKLGNKPFSHLIFHRGGNTWSKNRPRIDDENLLVQASSLSTLEQIMR